MRLSLWHLNKSTLKSPFAEPLKLLLIAGVLLATGEGWLIAGLLLDADRMLLGAA